MDVVSESQRFMLQSIIDSSRIAESSTKRKYSDSYISLGFTYTRDEIAPDDLRVSCNKVIPKNSILPAKLRRPLDTNHLTYKEKYIRLFKRGLEH
jgi:hypothetical protein